MVGTPAKFAAQGNLLIIIDFLFPPLLFSLKQPDSYSNIFMLIFFSLSRIVNTAPRRPRAPPAALAPFRPQGPSRVTFAPAVRTRASITPAALLVPRAPRVFPVSRPRVGPEHFPQQTHSPARPALRATLTT